MAVEAIRLEKGRTAMNDTQSVQISKQEALRRVAHALDTIRYGEIVIKIQGGKPIFVERRDQERVG